MKLTKIKYFGFPISWLCFDSAWPIQLEAMTIISRLVHLRHIMIWMSLGHLRAFPWIVKRIIGDVWPVVYGSFSVHSQTALTLRGDWPLIHQCLVYINSSPVTSVISIKTSLSLLGCPFCMTIISVCYTYSLLSWYIHIQSPSIWRGDIFLRYRISVRDNAECFRYFTRSRGVGNILETHGFFVECLKHAPSDRVN